MNEVLKLNLPEEIVIKILNGGGGDGSSVTTDSALSETSKNPVENKVISLKINEIIGNENSALGELSLTGLQKAVSEAFNRTVQNLDSITSVSERVKNKQDKRDIFVSGGSTTVGLANNQEVRVRGESGSFSVALMPDENGLYTDFEAYAIFNAQTFAVFAQTDLPYIVKFVGDDCNGNYEFTPQADTYYEVGIKYIGETVVEKNLGIPTYKHTFIARVGAC